jgi:L-rhamnose isomerase/sugar isomerase
MHEIVTAAGDPQTAATARNIAYMIDQSHNVEAKIPAMIRSVLNVQEAYAKALLVDRAALAERQTAQDVLGAHDLLVDAFQTDVRPLLAQARVERGLPADPMVAFRASGYMERVAEERQGGSAAGWH